MHVIQEIRLIHWPDRHFLLRHPAHFLALGFGSGLPRKAPGTWGTLVGIPGFIALMQLAEPLHYLILAGMFLLGIYICGIAGKALGASDHSSIVWDEIVAFMLVLEFTPLSWQAWLAAFLLFRLFDIWKPFPINLSDRHIKGGLGVMLDDLLAALYAIAFLQGGLWIKLNYWN